MGGQEGGARVFEKGREKGMSLKEGGRKGGREGKKMKEPGNPQNIGESSKVDREEREG